MLERLGWCAVLLAGLAAVAWWWPEDGPACDASRPVFGDKVCGEEHRLGVRSGTTTTVLLEETRRPFVATPARP